MFPHFGIVALAALVPMIMGFLYYNPKTVGTAWMKASGVTEEKMKGANMLLIFGLSLLLSFFLGMGVWPLVVHQTGVFSLFANDPGFILNDADSIPALGEFMDLYGGRFRTFGHGVVHGVMAGIFIVLPIMGTNNLFERRPFKLTLINAGYWTITLALMGGVLCQWG